MMADEQAAVEPVDCFELITDADREYLLGPPRTEMDSFPGFDNREAFVQWIEAREKWLKWQRERHPAPCVWCGGRTVHNPGCYSVTSSLDFTMPFGKYKGWRLGNIPPDYLGWLAKLPARRLPDDLAEALARLAGHKRGNCRDD